jgi:hypothetical protein
MAVNSGDSDRPARIISNHSMSYWMNILVEMIDLVRRDLLALKAENGAANA